MTIGIATERQYSNAKIKKIMQVTVLTFFSVSIYVFAITISFIYGISLKFDSSVNA